MNNNYTYHFFFLLFFFFVYVIAQTDPDIQDVYVPDHSYADWTAPAASSNNRALFHNHGYCEHWNTQMKIPSDVLLRAGLRPGTKIEGIALAPNSNQATLYLNYLDFRYKWVSAFPSWPALPDILDDDTDFDANDRLESPLITGSTTGPVFDPHHETPSIGTWDGTSNLLLGIKSQYDQLIHNSLANSPWWITGVGGMSMRMFSTGRPQCQDEIFGLTVGCANLLWFVPCECECIGSHPDDGCPDTDTDEVSDSMYAMSWRLNISDITHLPSDSVNVPINGTVSGGYWEYYSFVFDTPWSEIDITLTQISPPTPGLSFYVLPDHTPYFGQSAIEGFSDVDQNDLEYKITIPLCQLTRYYFGIFPDDTQTYETSLYITIPPPGIDSIYSDTPFSTTGNYLVTITGTNFGYYHPVHSTVEIGGVQQSIFNDDGPSWGMGQIVIIVAEGEGKDLDVTVVTSTLQEVTFLAIFSFDPPSFTSSPSCLEPCEFSTAGSDAVTITGVNFGLNPVLIWDGEPLDPGEIVSHSHTRIVFNSRPGVGTKTLNVSVAGNTIVEPEDLASFTYDPPVCTSISPSKAFYDLDGASNHTISGNNFGYFGQASLTAFGSSASISTQDHTSIMFYIPEDLDNGQAGQVIVEVNGQQCVLDFVFAAPQFISMQPENGPTIGGNSVQITGTNLGASGTIYVAIPGVSQPSVCQADPAGEWNYTHVDCIVPEGEGVAEFSMTTATSETPTSLSYEFDAPVITDASVTPNPCGTEGGYNMSFSGINFGIFVSTSYTQVLVDGSNTQVIRFLNHTHAIFTAEPGNPAPGHTLKLRVRDLYSNIVSFNYAPPTIDDIDPKVSKTRGNIPLTITGEDFGTNPAVTVGTRACPIAFNPNHTYIECTIPAGVGAGVDVVVSSGTNVSNPFSFDYLPPVLTSVTPDTGYTSGGQSIDLIGDNFGDGLAPDFQVTINGVVCTIAGMLSHTSVKITTPVGWGTNLLVVVRVSYQESQEMEYFSYSIPIISEITSSTPEHPTEGGNLVTITGHSFDTGGTVSIGDRPCDLGVPEFVWDQTQSPEVIICGVPEGVGLDQEVIVNTTHNLASNPSYYSYDIPFVSDVSVSGESITDGAYLAVISGLNFGKSVSRITFGSSECSIFESLSHTEVTCTVAEGEGASNVVRVEVSGQNNTNSYLFAYDAPEFAALDPILPDSGRANISITISGKNFGRSIFGGGGNTIVYMGDPIYPNPLPPVCGITSHTHSEIICITPSGLTGEVAVQINVRGQTNLVDAYFTYDPPNITSITPPTGPTEGGSWHVIEGSGLFFNPDYATFSIASSWKFTDCSGNDTWVNCSLPAGQGIDLELTAILGSVPSANVLSFSYDRPTIFDVTPDHGPAIGGIRINITGSSFGFNNHYVDIGDFACLPDPEIGFSHTLMSCILHSGKGVDKPLIVRSLGPQVSDIFNYSYDKPVVDTPVIPYTGSTEGGATLTITGENFGRFDDGGIAHVGDAECITSRTAQTWTDNNIFCTIPEGEGLDLDVTVTLADQVNEDPPLFDYNPPVIYTYAPTTSSTPGNITLTITGANFGLYPEVSVGGFSCPESAFGFSHDHLECTLPAGQGLDQLINVTVGGQTFIDNAYHIDYDAPSLFSIDPVTGPTDGSINITLFGTDFGIGTDWSVDIGVTVESLYYISQSTAIVTLPIGTGRNKDVTLTVASQPVTLSSAFSYYPPTITSVLGCPTTVGGIKTSDCSPAGTDFVTITGTNFGPTIDDITVTIDDKVTTCTLTTSHTELYCPVPLNDAGGFEVDVSVVVFGQEVVVNYLSYAGPILTQGTLRLDGQAAPTYPLDIPTCIAVTRIQIDGTNLDAAEPVVMVGPAGTDFSDKPYYCTVVSYDSTSIRCDLSVGAGKDHVVQVRVGQQYSYESIDFFRYPKPGIISSSIRFNDADAKGAVLINGGSSQGDRIYFDVENIGPEASFIKVYFSNTGLFTSECVGVTISEAYGLSISCDMPAGTGEDMVFKIEVWRYLSDAGTDRYNYPIPPKIYSLSSRGCIDVGNATTGCSTEGGQQITIYGTGFASTVDQFLIQIGASDCEKPIGFNNAPMYLTCFSPEGTGLNLDVRVIRTTENKFSEPKPYFSYAAPNLTSIEGCTQDGVDVIDCDREGDNTITVIGRNFGAEGAVILIGGTQCLDVMQDGVTPHRKATCSLPSGTTQNTAVLLLQGNGILSDNARFVSYTQCSPGEYENPPEALACSKCPGGSFQSASGQNDCIECEAGYYSSISGGATRCTKCNPGEYSQRIGGEGATECSECPRGTFTSTYAQFDCDDCETGTYTNYTRSTACTKCDAGSFASDSGTYLCTDCVAGEFSSVRGSASCEVCPSGQISEEAGAIQCVSCSSGQYAATATTCEDCSVGSYTSVPGQASCTPCESGKFANITRLAACYKCPVGKYMLTQGSSFCSLCSEGEYVNAEGQPVAFLCSHGTYSNHDGASVCSKCNAGSYSGLGASTCDNCTAGLFASQQGAVQCLPCSAGTFSGAGYSYCKDCNPGEYQSQSGQAGCFPCGIGTSTPSSGQADCKPCDSGRFANDTSLTRCLQCAVGTYSIKTEVDIGPTTCNECDLGTYINAKGQPSCQDCPVGTFGDDTGLSVCSTCVIGTYAPASHLTVCLNCAAGFFAANPGAISCKACQPGTYSEFSSASTTCVECIPGEHQPLGEQTSCLECGIGEYTSSNGEVDCFECAQGTFQNDTASSICMDCPEGYIQSEIGATACAACLAGTYMPTAGQAVCISCAAGSVTTAKGMSVCEDCETGEYRGVLDPADSCLQCPIGKYSPSVGSPLCELCGQGTFSASLGLSVCSLCDEGEYNDLEGQSGCVSSPLGTYVSAAGQSSYLLCPSGSYGPSEGASACIDCLPGQFTDDPAQSVCEYCPVGTFAPSNRSKACGLCSPGFFSNDTGFSSCYPCSIGSAQPNAGRTICNLCAPGTSIDVTGQKGCKICDPGTYATDPGSSTCSNCGVGRFSSDPTGAATCTQCLRGEFQAAEGQSECGSCPPGSFSSDIGATVCSLCNPGSRQPVSGMSTCTLCSKGYYSSTNGSATCSQCPAGSYQPDLGKSFCSKCDEGSYVLATGSTVCVLCSPGTYQTAKGQAGCLDCPGGSYALGFGSSICDQCTRGFYQPDTKQLSCLQCPTGQYNNAEGQKKCLSCTFGFYNPFWNATTCSACGIGTYQNVIGGTTCIDCKLGYYNPSLGEQSCKSCDQGTFVNDTGKTVCFDCEPGFFMSGVAATVCELCPNKTHASFPKQVVCDFCEPGTFSNTSGLIDCYSCSRGEFASDYGLTACELCDAGTFARFENQAECDPCAVGEFSASSGLSVCEFCDAGSFANVSGLSDCYDCVPGYTSVSRSERCDPCDPGSFTNVSGLVECIPCPTGSFGPELGLSVCEECDAGFFARFPGQDFCDPCLVGEFSASSGLSTCEFCESGTFANVSGLSDCHDCAPGFASSTRAELCDPCELGRFANVSRMSSCYLCHAGHFADELGSSACEECESGQYSNAGGMERCFPCTPGTFMEGTGALICDECDAGEYQDEYEATTCKDCGLGVFSPLPRAKVCTPCPIGRFFNDSGATICYQCDAGEFQDDLGQSSCKECLEGTASSVIGRSLCKACDPGTFSNTTGLSDCYDCAVGSAISDGGATVCKLCDVGYYSDDPGKDICDPCKRGEYSTSKGLSVCEFCDAGTFANATGLSDCYNCLPGFSSSSRAELCDPCELGRFANVSGLAACYECPAGHFADDLGSSFCQECESGRYSNAKGVELCFPCEPGTFMEGTGALICDECDLGEYQDEYEATTCKDCGLGSFAPAGRAKVCLPCPIGRFFNDSGATICYQCPVGEFQDDLGQSACKECLEGTAASVKGRPTCTGCEPGTFSNITGLSDCYDCAVGSAQPDAGATVCEFCDVGYYSDDTGKDYCNPCRLGEFSASGGLSICEFCDSGTFANVSGLSDCYDCAVGWSSNVRSERCDPCEPGTFANISGGECYPCPPGHFGAEFGLTVCEECEAGFYAKFPEQDFCDPCIVGEFAPTTGLSVCEFCDAGSFANVSGLSDCHDCAPGFASSTRAELCDPCELGRYANVSGMSSCYLCHAGHFSDELGSSACEECESGRYSNAQGVERCFPCDPGTFMEGTGAFICDECDAGEYQNEYEATTCKRCDSGAYSPLPRAKVCVPCPIGRFFNDSGATICDECPVGEYQDELGQSICKECLEGTAASVKGRPTCTACEPGTFANITGLSDCYECAVGSAISDSHATVCEFCDVGYYSDDTGKDFCDPCLVGEFSASGGLSVCEFCDAGTFANVSGLSDCYDCARGYTSNIRSERCEPCEPGSFANVSGLLECYPCASGSFGSELGLTVCEECSVGLFARFSGQDLCDPCAVGEYGGSKGLTVCEFCDAGSFANVSGLSDCYDCVPGYTSVSRSERCDPCDPGSFSNVSGLVECIPCPTGSFGSELGLTVCEDCEIGYFARFTGQDFCDPCAVGEFSASSGLSTCEFCDAGTFANVSGLSDCYDCAAGFSSVSRAERCNPCELGRYANVSGMTACALCDAGYFADELGSSACEECEAGQYSTTPGVERCSPCDPGTYMPDTGAPVCLECDAGDFQNEYEATTCKECDIGSYSPLPRAKVCTPCPIGRFFNDTGATICDECPAGKYQDELSQTSCKECELGTASDVPGRPRCKECDEGTFSNITGLQVCYNCPRGTAVSRNAATVCERCGGGKFADDEGTIECSECEPGTFTNDTGSIICEDCGFGEYQEASGGKSCKQCKIGTAAENKGQPTCGECSGRQVAPEVGMKSCLDCDINSEADVNNENCICFAGYYGITVMLGVDESAKLECLSCPDGADCTEKGTTFDEIKTLVGWWRPDDESVSWYRCLLEKHCEGGHNSDCQENRDHEVPLCAACLPGYHPSIGGDCTECPASAAESARFFVLVSVIMVLVLWLQIYIVLRSGRDLMAKARLEDLRRREEEAGFDADLVQIDEEWDDINEPQNPKLGESGPPPPPPNFTYKLKILIGFFQIITNLAMSLEVQWPQYYKDFVSVFNVINIDIVQLSSMDCLFDSEYYYKFLLLSLFPLALFALIFIFYLLPQYFKTSSSEDSSERKYSLRKFWRIIIFFLFLIYPVVSSAVTRVFVCKEVEGEYYMVADFREKCFTDKWESFALIAGFMCVLYPLGIPAFFFYLLYKFGHKARLGEVGIKAELGFLYDAYTRENWWFEMIDMGHKLLMVSIIAFFPDLVQVPMGMGIVILYSIILLIRQPYARKGDDRLHLIAQTELFLLLLAGHIFNTLEGPPDKATNIFASAILIAFISFFISYFVIQASRVLLKMRRLQQQRRKLKELREQAKAAGFLDTDDGSVMSRFGKKRDKRQDPSMSGYEITFSPLFDGKASQMTSSNFSEIEMSDQVTMNPLFHMAQSSDMPGMPTPTSHMDMDMEDMEMGMVMPGAGEQMGGLPPPVFGGIDGDSDFVMNPLVALMQQGGSGQSMEDEEALERRPDIDIDMVDDVDEEKIEPLPVASSVPITPVTAPIIQPLGELNIGEIKAVKHTFEPTQMLKR